jgi:hypothetical protein
MEKRASERGGRQGEERADWAACRVQTGRTGRTGTEEEGGKELGSLRLRTGRLATGTEEEERNQGAAATAHRNREGDLTLNKYRATRPWLPSSKSCRAGPSTAHNGVPGYLGRRATS